MILFVFFFKLREIICRIIALERNFTVISSIIANKTLDKVESMQVKTGMVHGIVTE